jgi:PilZ domain
MAAASQSPAPTAPLIESDADLVESARSGPGQTDNRSQPRYSFRGRAQAVVFSPPGGPDADPKEYEVITTDVSRAGLSLLHRAQLYPGQNILLLLTGGSKRLIEVCWCCRVWPGLYSAGCKFIDGAAEPDDE